ncbi:MAG: ABC transporter ATP-binding protein [Synechococcaceae cyanobacterium SM2_3_1]|nr:ABC transporter ATP-binding protein [Synechococcaceae cyanobacterium SM2_3_1]
MQAPESSLSASLVLSVEQLTVILPQGDEAVAVVDQVSFQLPAGGTLGIVGESGSGKTMTAMTLMGLQPGSAIVSGHAWLTSTTLPPVDLIHLSVAQQRRYRGSEIALVFQEPSAALNPVYSCGYQLQETIRAHESISRSEAWQRCHQLFAEVQLSSQLLSRYPHQLSGGQQQRVAIALAIACNPSLLIADEPTTALDVTVQAEILGLLRRLQQQRSMALIFITHDLGVVAEIADQVLVMYQGKPVEQGLVQQLFQSPQHPYTQGLLACRPVLDRRLRRLPTVEEFIQAVATSSQQNLSSQAGGIHPVQAKLRLEEVTRTEVEERLHHLRSQSPLLQVRHLSTVFPIRGGPLRQKVGEIRAVDHVSFDLYPGETLGLVGESGSGKSTLGRTILRLLPAQSGEIIYDGDDLLGLRPERLRRLRRELQLIFQDPFSSLDPRMTVGETVIEPMILHGLGKNSQERWQKATELFQKVGLDPNSLERLPHEFSGGQRQRICIARALAAQPRLIICDEAVSSLDVSVQAQVLNLLKQLQADLQLSYLFISHDLSVVKFMSDRMMVMRQGRIEEMAPADQIYSDPQTDYTRQLIAAIPGHQRTKFSRGTKDDSA